MRSATTVVSSSWRMAMARKRNRPGEVREWEGGHGGVSLTSRWWREVDGDAARGIPMAVSVDWEEGMERRSWGWRGSSGGSWPAAREVVTTCIRWRPRNRQG